MLLNTKVSTRSKNTVNVVCFNTCQIFTLGMNPMVATATLHHLAVVVIIIVALITQWAEVS